MLTVGPAAPDQLAAIRAEVNERGSAIVTRDKLQALCPNELSVPDQFLCVAEIASDQGWDFEFLGDRVVRFSSAVACRRQWLL